MNGFLRLALTLLNLKNCAEYTRVPKAVSCQMARRVHIALLLAGVTSEDIVLVPTLTFIAAVNPVKYLQAEPIFLDCDDSLCLDPDKLRDFCETQCAFKDGKLIDNVSGKHIKALIVVHVFGNMANLERILEITQKYNVKVIEDATEALGTYYLDGPYSERYAGTLGYMGVYSFNGNKIITTGGGGMIVSQDEALLQRAKHLTTQAKSDEVNFLHDEVGFNYRLTNLQAALGLAQMEQLEGFIETKIKHYKYYEQVINEIPNVYLYPFRSDVRANHWFYSLYLEDGFSLSRDRVIERFAKCGIQTRPIWGLIHEQTPYKQSRSYRIEKATMYQKRIVNIPCSTNITKEEIDRVIACLKTMVDET